MNRRDFLRRAGAATSWLCLGAPGLLAGCGEAHPGNRTVYIDGFALKEWLILEAGSEGGTVATVTSRSLDMRFFQGAFEQRRDGRRVDTLVLREHLRSDPELPRSATGDWLFGIVGRDGQARVPMTAVDHVHSVEVQAGESVVWYLGA
ncbi:MAG: twin-arginine translocation signal domain-containing protein [Candidatus Doudnabacteria bacterium]|nr:twin-arginine translocation signal domain-containing protein [Candidatus Doudnabacteria bacterium]